MFSRWTSCGSERTTEVTVRSIHPDRRRAALKVQEEFGSLATLLWDLVGGKTRHNRWAALAQIPAVTPDSERISKELTRRGFRFFGPTGAYAFMQAVGMVNDHIVSCFRYQQLRMK